ncbi:MAG: hypothetical protein ACLVK8_01595 [Ruminococcus sp.]
MMTQAHLSIRFGAQYTVIQSTPVLNGPFAYNGDTLSPEDVEAIRICSLP